MDVNRSRLWRSSINNSSSKKFKRRQYLVNPGFQLRFMLYLSIAVSIGLAILYLSNYFYFDVLSSEGRELGLDPSHPYYEFIQDQRRLLNRTYLIVSVAVFIGLMIFGLFLSHRVAGPIYRIESYLKQVTKGEVHLRPVTLRKGDFFPELADIVNDTIDHMSNEENKPEPE